MEERERENVKMPKLRNIPVLAGPCVVAGMLSLGALVSPLSAATTTRPAETVYTPPASKYPAKYPVSDRARSIIRTAREQIGLTTQDMQALGLGFEETRAALAAIRDWAEPRLSELEQKRDQFIAARGSLLSVEGKIFSLEQRLARLDGAAGADGDLRKRLMADLARQKAARPHLKTQFQAMEKEYDLLFASLIDQVAGILSLPQRTQWATLRANKTLGLPVTLQFIPDVTPDQLQALKAGENWQSLFTPEQQAINARAMERYRSHKPIVYRAEMKFFYGRDLTGDETPSATTAADSDRAKKEPHAESGSDVSKCPFHALLGSKRSANPRNPAED
ncbi:MAG: hypothetical protein AMXMBFR13_13040 [Phycisphaerae bacterium]